MNHIFLSGEHLFVAYVEDGDFPTPPGLHDTGIVDITNWPFDIMSINNSQCMVFADPNFMTTMGTGFTNNGELINGALVWRDHYLYRNLNIGELQQVADFPHGWHNLSREYYVQHYTGELFDELQRHTGKADNLHDSKKYQDEHTAELVSVFLRHKLPVRHCYSINVRTGGMSRQYRRRLESKD